MADDGRVVVVTGANRGLGREVARQCAARGDTVVLGSRDLDAAVAYAVESGATVAEFQPQDGVRVCLDPDGHPFCLFLEGS